MHQCSVPNEDISAFASPIDELYVVVKVSAELRHLIVTVPLIDDVVTQMGFG
jgi:hypothetical protein